MSCVFIQQILKFLIDLIGANSEIHYESKRPEGRLLYSGSTKHNLPHARGIMTYVTDPFLS